MNESERLERYQERLTDLHWANESDKKISNRIVSLLNDPKIDKDCMVDAYYYDFSVIPREIQSRLNLWRDVYLIYGITVDGEIVSRWVDRWDLDSDDEIVHGKVIYTEKEFEGAPEIEMNFNPKLLSTPTPNFMKLFKNETKL